MSVYTYTSFLLCICFTVYLSLRLSFSVHTSYISRAEGHIVVTAFFHKMILLVLRNTPGINFDINLWQAPASTASWDMSVSNCRKCEVGAHVEREIVVSELRVFWCTYWEGNCCNCAFWHSHWTALYFLFDRNRDGALIKAICPKVTESISRSIRF